MECVTVEYLDFLKSKEIIFASSGFDPVGTNDLLFQWQNDIVRWALKKAAFSVVTLWLKESVISG